MAKEYLVQMQITGTYYRRVEADSREMAMEYAEAELPEEALDSAGVACFKDIKASPIADIDSLYHKPDDGN